MDKYRIMTDLFLSNPKMKGWHPETVYETLKEMDKRGQLFIYKPGNKMKGFVGYVLAGDEYEKPLLKKDPIRFINLGRNVVPLFVWGKIGMALMCKWFRKMRAIATERGGELWSYRNNRIMKFGGKHG